MTPDEIIALTNLKHRAKQARELNLAILEKKEDQLINLIKEGINNGSDLFLVMDCVMFVLGEIAVHKGKQENKL